MKKTILTSFLVTLLLSSTSLINAEPALSATSIDDPDYNFTANDSDRIVTLFSDLNCLWVEIPNLDVSNPAALWQVQSEIVQYQKDYRVTFQEKFERKRYVGREIDKLKKDFLKDLDFIGFDLKDPIILSQLDHLFSTYERMLRERMCFVIEWSLTTDELAVLKKGLKETLSLPLDADHFSAHFQALCCLFEYSHILLDLNNDSQQSVYYGKEPEPFSNLQKNLASIDFNNAASLLHAQLLMVDYENDLLLKNGGARALPFQDILRLENYPPMELAPLIVQGL